LSDVADPPTDQSGWSEGRLPDARHQLAEVAHTVAHKAEAIETHMSSWIFLSERHTAS
jgi:hypothetical protein